MLKKTLVTVALASVAVLAIGCFEEEDSCNIRTAGVYVQYEVVERADGAEAKATFWTGDDPGGTYLELGSCGDTISVNGKKMTKAGYNPEYYKTEVALAEAYEFSFDRPDEGVYVSAITNLPVIPELTAPDGETFARDEEFDVLWDAGETKINLEISGDCIADFPSINGERINDDGAYTVNANTLEPADELNPESCLATVDITRSISGTVNGDHKGTIKAYTTDTVHFTTEP